MKASPFYNGVFTMLSNLVQNKSENVISAYIASADTDLAFDGKDWFPENFDLKSRSYWFSEQSDIDNGYIITEPYVDTQTGNIVTTISVPVRGSSGDILGVTAIDIQITTICDMVVHSQEMLDELSAPTGNVFQNSDNGENNFAVIGQELLSKFSSSC